MNAERREQVERIFLEAVELDPTAAAALLDARCGGDAELRHEVESLLGFASRAEKFLDHQELVELTPQLVRPLDEALVPGTSVGVYRIERMLGAGGMGVVYIATQDRPRRTVALKLVNALIASPSVRRRFELEAEVLGRLQHPGIAQVFEAGAANVGGGEVRRPFIAMELIDGPSINEYCEARGLSNSARVALIIKVCDAVQHAHQRGVIHRDLKPANILVTAEGQPKILDFGVARASATGQHITTIATGVGQLIGTLPYMSPEQVLGNPDDIDTRTDVYALGVILFELLAKRLPLDVSGRSLPEAVRAIRQDEPSRLSTVARAFRGDLDTIASKALEKDRTRRYQSAAELGEDLQRYLDGRPINAKEDSALYVLRKQLHRYRGGVAVAAAALVALVAFAVYAATQARTQRRLADMERQARIEADEARDMASARAAEQRRSHYVSAIGFAQAANAAYDATRVRRVLESCPAELRGWEWRYLRSVADSSASVVTFPRKEWNIGIARDGRTVAYITLGNPVIIYDTATGRARAELPLSESVITGACLSDDGETCVTGDIAGELNISSTITCRSRRLRVNDSGFIRPLKMIEPLNAVITQYGTWPSGSDYRLISLEDGRELANLGPFSILNTALSPDSTRVALGGINGEVWIIPSDGSGPRVELYRHDEAVRALDFSPDGSTIAVACSDGAVAVVPLDGGEVRLFKLFSNKATAVVWRPDGAFIAAGSTEGVIAIIDVAREEVVSTLLGHGGWIWEPSWDLRTNTLTTVSGDHTMRLWKSPEVPRQPRCMVPAGVTSGAWDTRRSRVYVGMFDGKVASLRSDDLGDQRPMLDLGQYITEIELSPAGDTMAVSAENGRVAVLDLDDGSVLAEWRSPANRAIDVDFDHTGARLLLGSDTPGMLIYEARTGKLLRHDRTFAPAVIRGDWSPDGRLIAAAYYDNVVRVHDAESGAVLHELHGQSLWTAEIRFTHDGRHIVAGCDDSNVYVWDVERGGRPRIISGHVRGVYGLSLSPDGKRMATGGYDNTFRIFDFESGEELMMFRRHTGMVWVADFSADGSSILSAATDGSAMIWRADRRRDEDHVAEDVRAAVESH